MEEAAVAPRWAAVSDVGTRPIVECRDLRKSLGRVAPVDGVSFRIMPGETYGLLGPNGAGKTAIISMVTGVLEADSGTVLVDGLPMRPGARQAKRRIGYVPQEVAPYPDPDR